MNAVAGGFDTSIRNAVYGDYGVASSLMQQVHSLHVSLRPDIYATLDTVLGEDEFRAYVDRGECVVSVCGGSVAGLVLFTRSCEKRATHVRRNRLFVDTLVVDEAFRAHGIGSALMAHIIALAKAEGADAVELQVNALNAAALRLYEEMGFSGRSVTMEYPLNKA